jgi:hypothetical protein
MRKLLAAVSVTMLLATCFSAEAQDERGPYGHIQRYGGHWRYQHRDWSGVTGRPDPGVCWQWDDLSGQWLWTCQG